MTNARNLAKAASSPGGLIPTGAWTPYALSTLPTGWIWLDGRTIGSASSGATNRANADCADLYAGIWNSYSNTEAPVTGGRGVSAAADWAANKPIALPDPRGRVPAGRDNLGGTAAGRITPGGSGIDGTKLGASGGAETHLLSSAQIPSHSHAASTSTDAGHTHSGIVTGTGSVTNITNTAGGSATAGAVNTSGSTATGGSHSHTVTVNSTGGDGAHNNTQPTLVTNFIIKL